MVSGPAYFLKSILLYGGRREFRKNQFMCFSKTQQKSVLSAKFRIFSAKQINCFSAKIRIFFNIFQYVFNEIQHFSQTSAGAFSYACVFLCFDDRYLGAEFSYPVFSYYVSWV